MIWPYQLTEESGEGYGFSTQADKEGKVKAHVIYRLAGAQEIDGKNLLKFEMHREGLVTNTDFMTVNNDGIACAARVDLDGETVKLDPPQTMIGTPLLPGTNWNFDGKAGEVEVHQHYRILTEENIVVPAGKFRAWHIHGEQTAPDQMTIDRWFVREIGIVKDVTTVRSESGDLVRRISLELTGKPQVGARPEVKPRHLVVLFSKETFGPTTNVFESDSPQICARWQGHGLAKGAKIRAVWIAENVGDVAPADSTIDEASTTATAPNAHGVFTLSKPEEGWAPGIYRVEFYVDSDLADAAKLKITK